MPAHTHEVIGAPSTGTPIPDDDVDSPSATAVAAAHMQRREWSRAAEVLSAVPEDARDESITCQRRLCRNLASLEEHRPGVLKRLVESPRTTDCQLVQTPGGAMTISQRIDGGQPVILSPGGEPESALEAMSQILGTNVQSRRTLVLYGVGDGQVLNYLWHKALRSDLGMEQVIHIVEPHVEVLWHILMILDLTGADGPIEAPRFHWWIGPDWSEQFSDALSVDMAMPVPEVPISVGLAFEAIQAEMRRIIDTLKATEDRWIRRLERLYADRSAADCARMIKGEGRRPPRIVMLTTRFSTVLQHSAADLCDAFESLGWRTRMPIEGGGHQRNTRRRLLRELLDFEPDLVMQIDHQRHEHGGIFPAQLPFACWIQDDLPNLTKRAAGARVGARDFVLTSSQSVYVADYGYPQRQCIHFTKQTPWKNEVALGPGPRGWLHDISFVSNASQNPVDLLNTLPADMCRDATLEQLAQAVCRRVTDVYERGGQLFAVGEVRRMIDEDAKQFAGLRLDGDLASSMAIRIFASLNNALYRQQALDWVVDLAQANGWSLGLYGDGWERHPKFARYARGSVQYGNELADLTARTKVNLQIVPYSCIHQRLLDGLSAGGFFLIREHPMDTLADEFCQRARVLLDDSIADTAQWRDSLDSENRGWLDDWMARRDRYVDHRGIDPVVRYRENMAENRMFTYDLFPHFGDVSFSDRAEVESRLARIIEDPAARQRIVDDQRSFVKSHYTYRASVEQMLEQMASILERETP